MKIYVFLDFSHLKSFKIGEKLCNILDLLIYSSKEKAVSEQDAKHPTIETGLILQS